MHRTLVIGFGNSSRRDDGAGLAVVNGLRRRLGKESLDENGDGPDDLGGELDTLFTHQLTPELAELLSGYDRAVFADARVGHGAETVQCTEISAATRVAPTMITHHMSPAALLALARHLYGCAPQAELVSILGHDFDFGTTLSPATAAAVAEAVDYLYTRYAS